MQPLQCPVTAEQRQRRVDRGRHRRSGDSHANRLREFAKRKPLRGGRGREMLMYGCGVPVGYGLERGDCRAEGRRWRRLQDGACLGVGYLDCVDKEEAAQLGHFDQGFCAFPLQFDDGFEGGPVLRVHAAGGQKRFQAPGDVGRGQRLQVMLVQPQKFLGIDARRGAMDVGHIEKRGHLGETEDLLVAMGPSKPHQIVQEGLGQIAFVAILHDAHGAMTLREPRAVFSENHRDVRVDRQGRVEGAQDVDLPWRVVQVIVAADDMGDAHVHVIDDDGEVVGGRAVGAGDDEIVEFIVGEDDASLDGIVDHDTPVERILEADDRLTYVCGRRPVAAAPVIARLFLAGLLCGTAFRKLLLGAGAVIGVSLREQLF